MEIPNWIVYAALVLIPLSYFVKKPLKEYYILWNIATAGRRDMSTLSSSQRMHAYVCKTQLLDFEFANGFADTQVSISELFVLANELVSADISIEQFHKVLLQYKYAAFFRDQLDGSLRGMLLIDPQNGLSSEGRCYNCIKMGLALFKDHYRGGPLGYFVGGYHLLKALVFYPRTPLYVLYKCFSYKSYLLSLRVSAEVYPRYDVETPTFEKSIIDEFGFSLSNEHDTYDPTTCVINRESSRLHTHVAPVTVRKLRNPNVAYFAKQNPCWDKGHCMIVLCRITWASFFGLLIQAIRRQWQRRGETRMYTNGLEQQLSLQETYERRYYSEIDPIWGVQSSSSENWTPQSPTDLEFSQLEALDSMQQ